MCSYFDVARAEGVTIAAGGTALKGPGGGHYVQPTLFAGAKPESRVAQEEIFGPVLSMMTVRTPEEAIERANTTPFGLSAGYSQFGGRCPGRCWGGVAIRG